VENNITNSNLLFDGIVVESANHSLDTQLIELRNSRLSTNQRGDAVILLEKDVQNLPSNETGTNEKDRSSHIAMRNLRIDALMRQTCVPMGTRSTFWPTHFMTSGFGYMPKCLRCFEIVNDAPLTPRPNPPN
jgi:hypothetical protein